MPSHADLGAERRARLSAARLYLICDSRPGDRELAEVLSAAIAGGVDIVQLRDKRLSEEDLAEVALAAGTLCRELGALFIVNDSAAVAQAVGADGVHVGQADMPLVRARELVGPDMLVGLSTHTPAQIDAVAGAPAQIDAAAPAQIDGAADYIGVGPVFTTPTKPGRPAVGLELVRYAAAHAAVPFYAIGGIDAARSTAVVSAGAQRLAVVRAIAEAVDPALAARNLRAALGDG
ncbi:MAG TPA: thiamine phosphate synthase [Solirubrobacteraceae bacterium]|jgi:thiamine-phosphate pyrophosphorylase